MGNYVNDNTPKVFLSRRNLLTLLHKLDRNSTGCDSHCMLIKYKSPSPVYQQSMKEIVVIAVDDEDYYTELERSPGEVHYLEEERLTNER